VFEIMEIAVKLKLVLKTLMESNNLTLARLSNATGVPKQTIHNWICGATPRSIENIRSVAIFFNLTIEELCFGAQPSEQKDSISPIVVYENEIRLGIFEVVLRRVKSNK
jgi:transcriptional regulator with XRE-family HTH domain